MDLQKIEELPYKDTIKSAYTYFAENLILSKWILM